MKVHLRKRKQTKNGSISLFLEIYKGTTISKNGKVKNLRDYKYLNLYLIDKPKTPNERQQNKDNLQLAEAIKSKTEIEIKNGHYGFTSEFKQNTNFVEFFKDQMEKRKQSIGNYGNWDSTLKHIINFAGENLSFREIDQQLCENFRDYLVKTATKKNGQKLSTSTVCSYMNKFRASLKEAVKKKIIPLNPAIDVSNPKAIESEREFLTVNELKAVIKAECRYDVLKRAFIFSCLTGLRWSDVNKLIWSELHKTDDGWRITFHQKKTTGLQYLDISEQAINYLTERGAPNERVFTGLTYSSYMNVELSKWMMRAGITKNITFHCARHTFGFLILDSDSDLYTLQKLLGHKNIKTTQIYAKILDKKKKDAVNKIPDVSS
jgi:integrase/recombinase XerD